MGRTLALVASTLLCTLCSAELQNVEVGGSVEIGGVWYSSFEEPNGVTLHFPVAVPYRALGFDGLASYIRADGHGNSTHYAEQRTRLHVKAFFSDDVSAFVELDSNDFWGEDFRSNYLNGQDIRAVTSEDVSVFQSYVEAEMLFGTPLRLRIGRQTMTFGSGWLVGENPASAFFTGLSFDAIRLTYRDEKYSLDAWWSKLAEASPAEEDGDCDFFGLYATRRLGEYAQLDAYYLYLRDAQGQHDTFGNWPRETFETWVGLDDYGVTELHTLGARMAGERSGFDWEAEVAYQWGRASSLGAEFKMARSPYGDDDARYDNWGGHAVLGYTFSGVRVMPRVSAQFEYYGGEDNRAISLAEWLSPFKKPQASVSFNRLFSDYENHTFLDGSGLSNHWKLILGTDLALSEKVRLTVQANHVEAVEPFDWPAALHFGYWQYPIVPKASFWTYQGSTDFGWGLDAILTYNYSEELSLELGVTRYFPGRALSDGVFMDDNGTALLGGTGHEPVNYAYFLTTISF